MSPQQNTDSPPPPHNTRPRPATISRARANTSFTAAIKKKGDPAPPTATTSSTTASSAPPVDILLSYLTPPLEPSLSHARQLAQAIPKLDPLPPVTRFTPVLGSLLAQDRPPALQAAGADIIAAFPASRLSDMERQIWATLLLDAPLVDNPWNADAATRRLAALDALTSGGSEILGLEPLLLSRLPMWIGITLVQRSEERQTFAENVAKLLRAAMTNEKNRGLFSEDDVVRVLASLEEYVTRALEEPVRRPSSPVASTRPSASRQPSFHKKHPSSLSQIPAASVPFDALPHAALYVPATLYIDFFSAFQPLASAAYTTHSLRVVCRILSQCMAPLPPLDASLTHNNDTPQAQLNERISELLLLLLDSRLTTTVLRSLKLFLRDRTVSLGAL
ncbi:hypothetical protein EXIGLDRAFT_846812, partial [Exidia glandulosa HHB12029]